jgi:hypothetical protein
MNNAKVKIQIEQAEIELTADQILKAAKALPNHEKAWLKMQLDLNDRPYPNVIKLRDEGRTPAEQLTFQMKETGYKGVNWQRVDELVKELDVHESIEELLKDLD